MSLNRRSFLASSLILAGAAALPSIALGGSGPECVNGGTRLMVHEWGTFTVLQDEKGEPVAGINTDDEVLPPFVHGIGLPHQNARNEMPASLFMKGLPQNHPDVWVRLETPVTYFYPPAGWDKNKAIDVTVTMQQGWLTQFYPRATPGGPDVNEEGRLRRLGPMREHTKGSLTWRGLTLDGMDPGPETKENTWLAPRKVRSATVHTTDKQQERYLFYRGVGRFNAPVKVSRADDGTIQLRSNWPLKTDATIGPLLLVDARPDGRCAFRVIDGIPVIAGDTSVRATFPEKFSEGEYANENLQQVRAFLHKLLLRDGMLEEEAQAMLNTWEVSYFKRPGLRLFFAVPRPWTEHVLPLTVSESADITRSMIGRIEIVTAAQRKTLATIAKGPASDGKWVEFGGELKADRAAPAPPVDDDAKRAIDEGRRSALEGRKDVPADYLAFLSLGRFRNALVLDELKRRPTAELTKFVKNYQLSPLSFAAPDPAKEKLDLGK
jgi:hypothetical protein